ncbi:MAG TPA: hypothetical protein VG844_01900 [Terracidiphilus sp.]|nr:hypothetical protein [Terracidiphilus sp.]
MSTKKLALWIGTLCGFAALCCSSAVAQHSAVTSDLQFHSSNAQLNQSFSWAKQQALDYVRPPSSPIGEWYEAALPGRNAFCMRDVSHQTTGAAALGLFAANRNMLERFANAVSASRNWAGYWEIDDEGKPSTEDYVSDADFWYNLPANFDVLDAIVRMWRWTGDNSYRDDPRIQSFFRETMTDYISQWQLAPDEILKRPRIANQRLREGKFVNSRGIPSYSEGPKDFIFGTDLLAAEYRAMRSYQQIAVSHKDKELAVHLQKTADKIQHILETVTWSSAHGHFNGVIRKNLTGFDSGDTMALYFDAVKDPAHIEGALAYISDPAFWKKINIEEETYVPRILFRYGRPAAAYQVLFDLSSPEKHRREYPEVSYAVIAAIVSGAMGIEPSQAGEEFDMKTLPQPDTADEQLSVSSLHIRGNVLDIASYGATSTQLNNREGKPIRWRAAFVGVADTLYADGRPKAAAHGTLPGGKPISWITVTVPSEETVTVSLSAKKHGSHK